VAFNPGLRSALRSDNGEMPVYAPYFIFARYCRGCRAPEQQSSSLRDSATERQCGGAGVKQNNLATSCTKKSTHSHFS
jgi:hypothetical protein